MSIAELIPEPTTTRTRHPASRAARWGPAHYLALAAAPLLVYQAWTLIGWLGAGPHQVTRYRTVGSASWYSAWVIQAALAVAVFAIAIKLVRECRRQKRLTFDAMLFIGLVLTVFWDTVVNFVEPLWFYSTNWLNLNEWWGHAPLVLNPAAGRGPFPLLALGLLYPFFVFDAMVIGTVMRRARQRWPEISHAKLIAVAFVPASLIGAILSLIMIVPHLWSGPGMPLSVLGGNYRYSIGEFLYIGLWSTTLASLRFFVDDRGHTLTERGLDRHTPRRRTAISLLATIAACNLSVIVWSSPLILTGQYAKPYPNYPRHLSNI